MQCPICGNALENVGRTSKRLKCTRCRHVFDRRQLQDYYGIADASERNGTHPYETTHMHATEQPHANRPDAVAKRMTTPKSAPTANVSPISSDSPIQPDNTSQAQMPPRIAVPSQTPQNRPFPQAMCEDATRQAQFAPVPAGKLVVWIIVIFVVLPFVFNLLGIVFAFTSNPSSNNNANSNRNATTSALVLSGFYQGAWEISGVMSDVE